MDTNIIERITESIAAIEEREPEDIDIAIQNHVSTEAIQQLVRHDSNSWRLQFETPRHVVEVMGDDTVLVDGQRNRITSGPS